MTTNKSKRETSDIDEGFLLQSIKKQDSGTKEAIEASPCQEAPEHTTEKPVEVKEPSKRRKNVNADYSSSFLQRNEFKARQCVYISQHIHNTISEIVRVIAEKDVTVGGYIDNVLARHLEAHKVEINDLYRRERTDLITF
jgi:hypothetical protein